MSNKFWKSLLVITICVFWGIFWGINGFAQEKPFTFALLLVGPYNDHGWSQAHYEAGKALEQESHGKLKMIYIDKVNPADRPGITVPQLVDELVDQGAKLIFATSDDMKDGIREAALQHPDVYFVHISGDDVLQGKAPKNLSNLMGKMIYGKMMAGFMAGLVTKTGKIAYLGPLINDETRRLANSAYLGARYAWTKVLHKDPKKLKFSVNWIGFWFNIPGVTADPTQVTKNFFNSGYDVVISGIDTTEAIVVAKQFRNQGKQVWAIPYDYKKSCQEGGDVCLGVPYFNWKPGYKHFINAVLNKTWQQEWLWMPPYWQDINNKDRSPIGFIVGPTVNKKIKTALANFIEQLSSKQIQLFKGPLYYQDGSVFLRAGEIASDKKIWYSKQLLKGMQGPSSAK
ncbi:MAG: BMP family ABC transporter substrate-binding protein [Desulfonauticus sp.]|nr:BMP family ABC transporter substrate-binding protein [Desulfonauticus sp.]